MCCMYFVDTCITWDMYVFPFVTFPDSSHQNHLRRTTGGQVPRDLVPYDGIYSQIWRMDGDANSAHVQSRANCKQIYWSGNSFGI